MTDAMAGSAGSPFVGRTFDAVVVGASAGGVEALSTILSALRPGFPAAMIVVQHLPAGRPSLLVDIFARKCALPVLEPVDKEPLVAGCVYFAPPDYHLLVDVGPQFALTVDALINYSRPAIDPLFESAADLFGERLLGIVLTGASHDGAAGLQAVLARGGAAIVQDPATAHVAFMPESAAARCPSAPLLSVDEIAAMLADFAPCPTSAMITPTRAAAGGAMGAPPVTAARALARTQPVTPRN